MGKHNKYKIIKKPKLRKPKHANKNRQTVKPRSPSSSLRPLAWSAPAPVTCVYSCRGRVPEGTKPALLEPHSHLPYLGHWPTPAIDLWVPAPARPPGSDRTCANDCLYKQGENTLLVRGVGSFGRCCRGKVLESCTTALAFSPDKPTPHTAQL